MLSFETLDILIHGLAATMRGNMDDFERTVEALIERAGWQVDEFFAVRRGDVIVVNASAD